MDQKELQYKVDEIIKQVPGWETADQLQVEPLEGLTNSNYAVTVNWERFVLRVSGQNAAPLGVNRRHEAEILTSVSDAGIGAQVAYYQLPEGHLVTRYINGRHLLLEEYRTPISRPTAILGLVVKRQFLGQVPSTSKVRKPLGRSLRKDWPGKKKFSISGFPSFTWGFSFSTKFKQNSPA